MIPDQKLSKQILNDPTNRYCEIYKIINKTSGKIYVGQAVSHILNHKKYRPYGREGRFKCHISEAFSSKKNQSHYLNNALRKYGVSDFTLELIEYCEIENADDRERYHILQNDSLFPNGFNLKLGGQSFTHSTESKKRVSDGLIRYYENKKYERFQNTDVTQIGDDLEKYIRPLRKNNEQYGWYVYIDNKKADFGGIHTTLAESKQKAREFILNLKYSAKHLVAGNPLEPLLPLDDGNIIEELG